MTSFLYWLPGIEYGLLEIASVVSSEAVLADIAAFAGSNVTTLPEALITPVPGVVVCLASLHAVNLAARVLGLLTELLLESRRK